MENKQNKPVIAFLAFGGNIGNVLDTFDRAMHMLSEYSITVLRKSSLYRTKAMTIDGAIQPQYINSVIEIETSLETSKLLELIHTIEKALGRDRANESRWASRMIDIDIIFYGDQEISTSNLVIPHPELHKRDFVLVPLVEIAPDLIHPKLKVSVKQLLENIEGDKFVTSKVV